MPSSGRFVFIVMGFMVIYLIAFGLIAYLIFPKIDSSAAAGILGAIGGALFGFLGASVTTLVAVWDRTRELTERLKDRVSNHAIELAKMDYELRQKSLEFSKTKKKFLAPVKVYREFYKALLELHEKGTWPKKIEELGLLRTFEIGAEDKESSSN